MQDEHKYKKPRPETTGRSIIPVVPPELPQKRSLLSRCNVRNTSPLLEYRLISEPFTRNVTKTHAAPFSHTALFGTCHLIRHPLGLLLGSVIHTDSDMRLSPCPHSLGTNFCATSLRHRIWLLFVLYHL